MTQLLSVISLFTRDYEEEIMLPKTLWENCPKYFNFPIAHTILTDSSFFQFILLRKQIFVSQNW